MDTIETLDDLVGLVVRRHGVFLRYSEGPEADRRSPSTDYEADVELPGWSVTSVGPEPWWTRPAVDWIARRVCKYADLAGKDPSRRPWILAGTVVGQGPDHEPLVTDVEPIAWLAPAVVDEAIRHYQAVFHVGRDSTRDES